MIGYPWNRLRYIHPMTTQKSTSFNHDSINCMHQYVELKLSLIIHWNETLAMKENCKKISNPGTEFKRMKTKLANTSVGKCPGKWNVWTSFLAAVTRQGNAEIIPKIYEYKLLMRSDRNSRLMVAGLPLSFSSVGVSTRVATCSVCSVDNGGTQ